MTTPQPLAKTTYMPRGGLALSCAILLFCMLAALLAVSAWASANHGSAGIQAALVAWLLCTAAAFAALLLSVSFSSTPLAPTANLGSMGIRMVELLKQGQFAPLDVVDQVVVIFAANQGFLDKVPAREVQNWEKQFLQFLREQRAQLRANLAEKKELTPEIVAEIEGALKAFANVYKAGA